MKKWNAVIDVENCNGCNLCTLAVQDEYVGNEWPGYSAEMPKHGHRWIDIKQKVRGEAPLVDAAYLPVMCQHCDDAPCLKVAKNNAVKKRDDGIIIIDPEKSKGQKQIADSCPHNAIWWNKEKEIPQIWNFDAHLLDDGWTSPRAEKVCATGCFQTLKVEDSEMKIIAEKEKLEHLNPEHDTKPRVWYKNLYRYRDCFIAGSVAFSKDGVTDCAEGAEVILQKNEETISQTITDNFGDFKFDRLRENSGNYKLKISFSGQPTKEIDVELSDSQSFPNIVLD